MTSRPWRQCRNGRGKRQPSAATAEDPSFGGARDGFGTDTLTVVRIVLPSSRRREPGKLATLPSILDFGGPVSPPGPLFLRESCAFARSGYGASRITRATGGATHHRPRQFASH